jgi:predicted MFS family arabinose efflux permease
MKDSLRRYYFFFWINYFVQSTVGIIYEPVNYLLKDRLHLTPGEASGFYGWITFPLLLKPLYGFVSDFIPLGRYRRKPHLALAALVAAAGFFSLAAQSHYRYVTLLVPLTVSIFAMAFADAVCGGLLVEDGKQRQQTGRYQALHIGALYLGVIIVGAGGGWMTTHVTYPWIFAIAGLMPLAMAASVTLVQEGGSEQPHRRDTGRLWSFVRTPSFWALALTIVLWNFYPFLGTVQFYYQTSVLRLSPQWIGSLMTIGSVAGFIGSAVFWKFCRNRDVKAWTSWGPVGMSLVSLSYLFYRGPISVSIVEILFGFASVFFRLALLDLIARNCPADAEATSYALFLSLFDLAMFGSNTVGGKLYDVLHRFLGAQAPHDQASYAVLILIGAGCTLACRWTLKFCSTAST